MYSITIHELWNILREEITYTTLLFLADILRTQHLKLAFMTKTLVQRRYIVESDSILRTQRLGK